MRNSFFGWLGHEGPAVPAERVEAARKAMLAALDEGKLDGHAALERRLLFAKDMGELWYARPDLMNALAASIGEARARERLVAITALFDGMQPGRRR